MCLGTALCRHFNYDSVVTDAGQGAASEMPWAGNATEGIEAHSRVVMAFDAMRIRAMPTTH